MRILRRLGISAGLFVVFVSGGVFAELEGEWKLDLRFEESEVVQGVGDRVIRVQEKPSFVGEVYLKVPRPSWSPYWRRSNGYDFPRAGSGSSLPEEVWQYVRVLMGRNLGGDNGVRNEPNDVMVHSVYGRNREEVEAVVRGILKQLNKSAFEKRGRVERELAEYKRRVPELEGEVASLPRQSAWRARELKEYREKYQYVDAETARMGGDEAWKALRLSEIEIAGIKARLDAAGRLKDQNDRRREWSEEVAGRMFVLRLELEIELAGAMTRQTEAKALLGRCRDFVEWSERLKEIPHELEEKRQTLSLYQSRIPKLERMLAEPDIDMMPVELARETILIHPVEFE